MFKCQEKYVVDTHIQPDFVTITPVLASTRVLVAALAVRIEKRLLEILGAITLFVLQAYALAVAVVQQFTVTRQKHLWHAYDRSVLVLRTKASRRNLTYRYNNFCRQLCKMTSGDCRQMGRSPARHMTNSPILSTCQAFLRHPTLPTLSVPAL